MICSVTKSHLYITPDHMGQKGQCYLPTDSDDPDCGEEGNSPGGVRIILASIFSSASTDINAVPRIV